MAELCDEYRTERTVVLDLSAVTPVFDYFVITTGTNPRQMSALADEADKTMKAAGSPKFGTEGHAGRQWILHDYGDVVLHILSEQARSTYDLEGLWADATPVEFASAAAADGHAEGDAGPAEA
ncbi:MAG: ribosome silencing factor [Planctomycetota bacterium]